MRRRLAVLTVAAAGLVPWVAWADGSTAATCSDAYTSAQTLRNEHKLVQARDALRACAQTTCKEFIVKDCTAWLDQVQASIPSIVPVATDAAGNDIGNVRVSMDGAVLLEKIEGRSVEVNPGLHTFTFETPGGSPVERQVVVAEGEKNKRIAVPIAGPVPAPATPVSTSAPSASASVVTPSQASPVGRSPAPDEAGTSSAPWKTIGLVTAGGGVVGIAVGSGFGIDASNKKSSAGCNSNSYCPSAAAAGTLRGAKSSADLSTVFFVVGGLLGAGGIALWALAPSSTVQASPNVGAGLVGLDFKGSW